MLSHRVFRISLALATALVLLGVPNLAQADCLDEWNGSSADETCDQNGILDFGDRCQIHASCGTRSGDWVNSTITVSLDDVADLHNCDGSLQVGNC